MHCPSSSEPSPDILLLATSLLACLKDKLSTNLPVQGIQVQPYTMDAEMESYSTVPGASPPATAGSQAVTTAMWKAAHASRTLALVGEPWSALFLRRRRTEGARVGNNPARRNEAGGWGFRTVGNAVRNGDDPENSKAAGRDDKPHSNEVGGRWNFPQSTNEARNREDPQESKAAKTEDNLQSIKEGRILNFPQTSNETRDRGNLQNVRDPETYKTATVSDDPQSIIDELSRGIAKMKEELRLLQQEPQPEYSPDTPDSGAVCEDLYIPRPKRQKMTSEVE